MLIWQLWRLYWWRTNEISKYDVFSVNDSCQNLDKIRSCAITAIDILKSEPLGLMVWQRPDMFWTRFGHVLLIEGGWGSHDVDDSVHFHVGRLHVIHTLFWMKSNYWRNSFMHSISLFTLKNFRFKNWICKSITIFLIDQESHHL